MKTFSPLTRVSPKQSTKIRIKFLAVYVILLLHQIALSSASDTSDEDAHSAVCLDNSNTMALTPVQQRGYAAIIGAFVGDAATMGVHWIYDQKKLADLVGSGDVAFHEPPACPFYNYPSGALSPYGDESLALLRSVSASGGFVLDDFIKSYYDFAKHYTGRLNHISKSFITSYEEGKKYPDIGADDSQANCLVKVPILVARYAGQKDLESIVEHAIRVHQNNQVAVDYGVAAAQILNRVILGESVQDALKWARTSSSIPSSITEKFAAALEAKEKNLSLSEAATQFGLSCALPGSFQVPVVALKDTSYEQAVRENALAAGDQCSRIMFAGACIAAERGLEAVPSAWQAKTSHIEELKQLAHNVVSKHQ